MAAEGDLRLPFELGQALVGYLGKKPYEEVYQIIAALQGLAEIAPPAPPAPPADG